MTYRVFILACSIGLVLLVARLGNVVHAQNRQQCFTETKFCVEGRFLDFWRANGGLPVFGYPVSPIQADTIAGREVQIQWFERTRLELHAENAPPYDALLGRVGAERLQQLDRDWQREPRESGPKADCLWFAQTGHNVCNQASALGFKSYWQSHGLQDKQLDVAQRSLALFGLPLTEAQLEPSTSDQRAYLTQWFERARFEWHPEKPDRFKVLLGLLGTELRTAPLTMPLATPTPEHTPTPILPTPSPPTPTNTPARRTPPPAPTPRP